MKFKKGVVEIAVMLCVIAALSKVHPAIGFLLCVVVLLIALFAVIRPLPAIRLPSRLYNLAVAVVVGVLGMAIPIVMLANEQKRMTELRASNPVAYLSELEAHDKKKWLTELQSLDPARYAEVKAKADAEQAEQARAAAAAKAKADAEQAERARAAAEAKAQADAERADAERAAALRNLEADQADLRHQISALDWSAAKRTLSRIKQAGADLTGFQDEMEAVALKVVKALPSATTDDMKANQAGYEFLAALRPDNETYPTKAAAYAERIEQSRKAVVSKLRRTEDKVEGTTFYEHPNQPKYLNSRSTVYLYIGRQGESGTPWLRMQVQYTASEWLFVNNVYAWHDGIKEDFFEGSFNRDNNTTIWEWVDVRPTPDQLATLESLANAKEAVLRFEGMQYRKDVTLSAGDKQALREVLLAYHVMLGED